MTARSGAENMAPAIELRGISKAFGPVQANKGINLSVPRGTIHGIIGENGAGKSTLMSILYGFYRPDSGEILIGGKPIAITDSQTAIRAGIGVLQAAADAGILSVGVDSNQNHLHPGKVLTSMVKGVDNSVYEAFTAGAEVQPGIKVMDLASGGVSVAMDDNNKPLVTPEMAAAVEAATKGIADGSVKVHDYMTDNTCPVQ